MILNIVCVCVCCTVQYSTVHSKENKEGKKNKDVMHFLTISPSNVLLTYILLLLLLLLFIIL
jgi:hypothetical protein